MTQGMTAREPVDVLLTHSYHLYYDRKQAKRQQPYPPLGTLYAAALVRDAGFSVAVFDTMINEPGQDFDRALEEYQPRLLVICEDSFNFLSKMCLSRMREVSFSMLNRAKAAGVPAFVHGSDSSDNIRMYLDHGFRAVLLGECERTLVELVHAILRAGEQEKWKIQGLAYLRQHTGELVRTGARDTSHDLSRHPLPARDLISIERYRQIWSTNHGRSSINIVASRGCPFRCNWCAKPVYGNRFAIRPAESVAAEMSIIKHDYGVDHLWFADDVFALNRHWVQEFAAAVERHDAVMPYKIQSRADLMTAETVEALKRSGCEEVWMGAESGSQTVLNLMDKGLRVESIREASAQLQNAGIRAAFFLQFGYPGETLVEIEETIELVRSCRPNDIGVSVSYPLPGTAFYQRVQEQLGAKRNWVDSDDFTLIFRAAYTDEFYRSLRNTLHFEVEQYSKSADPEAVKHLQELWQEVYRLEKRCKNAIPTQLPILQASDGVSAQFMCTGEGL